MTHADSLHQQDAGELEKILTAMRSKPLEERFQFYKRLDPQHQGDYWEPFIVVRKPID